MRALLAAMVLASALALSAAPALAQHAHGTGKAMVVVAHDSPPDGRAVVGNVAHFAAVLFGADGMPQFHHNMVVEVRLNGVVLWATTSDSGHDYDGVNGFDLVFPAPGRYNVTVTTDGDDGDVAGSFEGDVVPADGAIQAELKVEGPGTATAFQPATFGASILDAAGAPLPHTDLVFEVREGGASGPVAFRTHLHGHDGPTSFDYAFSTAGEHTLTWLAYNAYPTASAPVFPAFTASQRVMVQPGLPVPSSPAPQVPMVDPALNNVTMGTSDAPYIMLTTFDPYTSTGPFGQTRLSTLVVDPERGETVQHVNFQATLTDLLGNVVFHSASLHEYDGILEVLAGRQFPGQYLLDVQADAMRGAWKGSTQVRYTVLPPVEALSLGPQLVEAQGLDQATSGTPWSGVFSAHDLAGMPFAHSEIDLQVLPAREGAPPVVATKLHTHDDGLFPFTLTFAEPGDYVLRLAPFPLEARPTPVFFGANLGDPLDFPLRVAAGVPLPGAPAPLEPSGTQSLPRGAPGFEAATLAFAALVVAISLARRRGP